MSSSDGSFGAFQLEGHDSAEIEVGGRDRNRRGNRRERHLLTTIESEIIPRLVLSRRGAAEPAPVRQPLGWMPGDGEIAEFADLVSNQDVAAASTRIEAFRSRGITVETLYLELLAPTARYLGDLWDADIADFTSVTLGCSRLQQLLHELSPAFVHEIDHHEHRRRVLLVPVPGEQHTFGVYMVAEFFRRAGWDVWSGSMPNRELAELVSGEAFTLVGFSISADDRLDALASSIRSVRRASCNRGVGVLVGGPVFVGHPELVSLVGADATAIDARQATHQAQSTLSLLGRGR